jgi:hypothetical protein
METLSRVHKMRGISRMSEDLLDSQEGFCSMELNKQCASLIQDAGYTQLSYQSGIIYLLSVLHILLKNTHKNNTNNNNNNNNNNNK